MEFQDSVDAVEEQAKKFLQQIQDDITDRYPEWTVSDISASNLDHDFR